MGAKVEYPMQNQPDKKSYPQGRRARARDRLVRRQSYISRTQNRRHRKRGYRMKSDLHLKTSLHYKNKSGRAADLLQSASAKSGPGHRSDERPSPVARSAFPCLSGCAITKMAVKDTGKQGMAPSQARGASVAHPLTHRREADAAAGLGHEDASRYCPVCSQRLESHRCKLVCGVCGYYMSCADYY